MNLKQAAGFTMLAGIGVALTVGTVAGAVTGSGGSGSPGDPVLADAASPFPTPAGPFTPEADPVLPQPTAPEASPPDESGGGRDEGEIVAEPSDDAGSGTTGDIDPGADDEPSATATPEPATPEPGTGAPGTPDPSSSPNGQDTDTPTAPYTDGYLPPQWIRGVSVACGSPADDLTDEDPDLTTEITGDYDPATGTLPVTVSGSTGADDVVGAPVLVWSQEGVLVDLGLGWHEADYVVAEALAGQGLWDGIAIAPSFSTCLEDTDDTAGMGLQYDNERAPGTYDVRAVVLHTVQKGGGRLDRLEVSDPVQVVVE